MFPVVGKMFQITVLLEKRMILDSSPLTYKQISFFLVLILLGLLKRLWEISMILKGKR
jgi:hypothetical protein